MKKAQVSAPIELLVGVIILTMVLIVGFYTYNNMCLTQYEQKIKASLGKFSNTISTVYRGGRGAEELITLDFTSMGCGEGEISYIQLIEGTQDYCLRNVGSDGCFVLIGKANVVADGKGISQISFTQPLFVPSDVDIVHNYENSDESDDSTEGAVIEYMSDIMQDTTIYGGWSSASGYKWGPTIYSLVIRKEENNKIAISETEY